MSTEFIIFFIIMFLIIVMFLIISSYIIIADKIRENGVKKTRLAYPEVFKLREVYRDKVDNNFALYQEASRIKEEINEYVKEEAFMPNEIVISKMDEIEKLKKSRWTLLQEYNKREELLQEAYTELFKIDFSKINTEKAKNLLAEVIFDNANTSDFTV